MSPIVGFILSLIVWSLFFMSELSNVNIGLIYGTDTNNTEEVGERISAVLQSHGCIVEIINVTDLEKIKKWLLRMQTHLIEVRNYDLNFTEKIIGVVWFQVCTKMKYNGIRVFFIYLFQSHLKKSTLFKSIKLLIQCILSSFILLIFKEE